jgi:hypothetical protein
VKVSGSQHNPLAPLQETFAWVELDPKRKPERKPQPGAPRAKPAARAKPPARAAAPRGHLAVEAWDDVYADPIDGIPFEAGEQVIQCVCGTAYRLPTVAWLREMLNGECTLCHAELHRTPRTLARQRCFDAAAFAAGKRNAAHVWETRPSASSNSGAEQASAPR